MYIYRIHHTDRHSHAAVTSEIPEGTSGVFLYPDRSILSYILDREKKRKKMYIRTECKSRKSQSVSVCVKKRRRKRTYKIIPMEKGRREDDGDDDV